MASVKGHMTLQEFEALPEQEPPLELIDGAVQQKVSPQGEHVAIQAFLFETVNGYGRSRRLALAFPEWHGSFRDDSLVPDVLIYRWARIPRTAAGRVANRQQAVPDVAVEVLSPDRRKRDARDKCRRSIASGVPIALLIDTRDETAERYGGDGSVVVLRADDRIDLDLVLPGFELTVVRLCQGLDVN